MCPECPNCRASGDHVVRNGHYFRKSDSRQIQNFLCKGCRRYFSSASFSDCYRQKKRRINEPVREMLSRGMAMRDIAATLSVSRTTITRKLIFLGEQSRRRNAALLERIFKEIGAPEAVQFDDLITAVHTKCKPVTAGLLVQEGTRFILGHRCAQIPAFGHLAAISREKYGKRPDKSRRERHALFASVAKQYPTIKQFRTDEHKHYPIVIKKYFPNATHLQHKSKRSATQGQGELKATGRDPLFSVNHTLAMLRSKMSRLHRRSWNLSRKIDRLEHHIAIYAEAHNRRIWQKMEWLNAKNFA